MNRTAGFLVGVGPAGFIGISLRLFDLFPDLQNLRPLLNLNSNDVALFNAAAPIAQRRGILLMEVCAIDVQLIPLRTVTVSLRLPDDRESDACPLPEPPTPFCTAPAPSDDRRANAEEAAP